ncbi:iron-sulfur cluster biosynthesis family protein [Paenibacillaceae bacterium WGS1546]|uniref:iron-sulfur cluster biosynthesis family protein n=1 Tax=Cohnella sp. WGS1546 TaxID=3366810 RepID=UPI00372D1568
MILQWSDQAARELRGRFGEDAAVWKLAFDAEGCGCAMNGVPAIWAIDAPEEDDLKADSDAVDVYYEKRHEVFFDESMRISYDPSARAFKLASDGQIYSNRLRIEDRRVGGASARPAKEESRDAQVG